MRDAAALHPFSDQPEDNPMSQTKFRACRDCASPHTCQAFDRCVLQPDTGGIVVDFPAEPRQAAPPEPLAAMIRGQAAIAAERAVRRERRRFGTGR